MVYFFLENVYESNFVFDIVKVDYLVENFGCMNLCLFVGLLFFVDDIYVFGYFFREECVFWG